MDVAKTISSKYSSVTALYCRQKEADSANSQRVHRKSVIHLRGVKSVSRKPSSRKNILNESLKDIYIAYIQENHTDKASLSTFCKHRPKHILSYIKTPFIQYVCEIC